MTDPRVDRVHNWLLGSIGVVILAVGGWTITSIDALNQTMVKVIEQNSQALRTNDAQDGGDTNFQIMHNDGASTATKVDTGLAFAANKSFELELSVPSGGGTWNYSLVDLDTGVAYTGSIAANIPANDTALFWRLWGSVGASAGTAVAVDAHYIGLRYPL